MLFFLLALGAYRWYAREPRVGRYAVVALLFALGLMSKPQVITLPCVLLLWDYWPLRRMSLPAPETFVRRSSTKHSNQELLLAAGGKVPAVRHCRRRRVHHHASAGQRAAPEIGFRVSFGWATRLSATHDTWERRFGRRAWRSFIPIPAPPSKRGRYSRRLLFLLAVTALVVIHRRRRYLTVGWLWFLGTLVPMIGLIQVGVQAMADRYAYLSFIGLFIMICWGVADWSEQRHISASWLAGCQRRGVIGADGSGSCSTRPLERQCHSLDAHLAGDRAEFHRRE